MLLDQSFELRERLLVAPGRRIAADRRPVRHRPQLPAVVPYYGRLASAVTAMEFRLLGPLEVVEDDRPLALGGAKQRALLAMLLLHANRGRSRAIG